MADTVFLGAGASVEFGVPAAFRMTDTFLEMAGEDDGHDGRVNAILQFVVGKLAGPDGNPVNVENLFSTLDAYVHREDTNIQHLVENWNTDFKEMDQPFRAKHDNVEKSGSAVAMEWLFIRLKRLTIYSHHPNRYYPAFVSAAENHRATIATVNYDNAVELAAKTVDVDVADGYDSWLDTFSFDFGDAVTLLKLHGSTTWGMGNRPTLVFGSGNKLRYYGPFLDLLAEFRRTLFGSDVLRIIGYSFGDPHINEIIKRWQQLRGTGRMVVVDIDDNRARESLLGAGLQDEKVTFIKGPASTILPEIFDH